ncbi:MAG: NRDE family protein [Deinococcota bacterium]
MTLTAAEDGIWLVSSRDELHSRVPSLAPQYHQLDYSLNHQGGALEAIFPIDPEGGGTWVGANAAGMAVSLLNNYPEYHPPLGSKRSRGQLVTQLLSSDNLEQAMHTLTEQNLHAYGSCTLVGAQVATQSHPKAYALTWDGQQVQLEDVNIPQLWASSGTHHAEANQYRKRLFEVWRQQHAQKQQLTRNDLSEFHLTRQDDASELGVLMYGSAARTVSLTAVHVAEVISVHHVDIPKDVAQGVQDVSALASPTVLTLETLLETLS